MKDRPRRGRQFWHTAIEEQRISGMSIAKWCQQHQLAVSTFCKWKQKLKTNKPTDAVARLNSSAPNVPPMMASELVELTPVASPVAHRRAPMRLIEASLADGTLLRFHGSIDADTIQALISSREDHSGGQA